MDKQSRGKEIYGDAGMSFDCNLDQVWLDAVCELDPDWNYDKILVNFVWIYPMHSVFGKPGPLSEEAEHFYNNLHEDFR